MVVHDGTNSLANYVFDEGVRQHWEAIVDQYVRLAEKFLDLYGNDTQIVMSGVLPRIDW